MTTEAAARQGLLDAFGTLPTVVVRAPGRVNLIGEHTDYSDLPVLPIAIEQSLYVASAPTIDGNINAQSREFSDDAWRRYVIGAVEQLRLEGLEGGANLFVASDIPSKGGLSSSAALTCGVLAALSAAWRRPLEREDVVRLAMATEHTLGLQNGGMDQTAILFAHAGKALRVDFRPPSRRAVPIPDGLHFVVASSGELAPKSGDVMAAYNDRVDGTRAAALLLAHELGTDLQPPPTLAQVAFTPGIMELLEPLDFAAKPLARHVLTEARRVDEAEAALASGDLRTFGDLLNASHASLRGDFGVSTPALDRLCSEMREAGAFGARLTGAGFGGFALAACGRSDVDAVIAAAMTATGGPAFEVRASGGLEWL